MLKRIGKCCLVKSSHTVVRTLSIGPDLILPAIEHRGWEADAAVNIKIQENGPQSVAPISVPSLFKNTVENLPNKQCLVTRTAGGEELDWTWSQYFQDVQTVTKGFISLGLERFHTVGILGHNCPEWHMSCLGAIQAGGFATGIYQTSNSQACQYIAKDSRANILVVDDDIQLAKILGVKDQLPHLKAIIQYAGTPSHPGVIGWKELMEIGKAESDSCMDERLRKIAINQACMLTYTSGTTGNPKGTMLSHDNLTFAAKTNTDFFNWSWEKESVLSFLPLSHIAGLVHDIMMPMSKGATCYFADKNALKGTLLDNFKLYRPTRLVAVPRVFEKIEEGLKVQSMKTKGAKKLLVDWAKNQALHHHEMEMTGKPHTSLGYRLARKLVLSRVHEALGFNNCVPNDVACGGAAVSPQMVKYFLSLDIKILEMISSTEVCGMIQLTNSQGPGNFRVGKVGKAHDDQMEVKLVDMDSSGAGELLTRGRSTCMGYLNNKEKTMEAIDEDGWLYSGDLCRKDDDGFYTVVGRIKEILITAGGENVAPTNIEDQVKMALPHVVSNVIIIGDKRKYCTSLITLKVQVDPATMEPTCNLEQQAIDWIASIGGGEPKTVSDVLTSEHWPKIKEAIEEGFEKANENAISNVAKIKKWRILPNEFSVSGGELGPSLKLKRFQVAEMYKDVIEEMYSECTLTVESRVLTKSEYYWSQHERENEY